MSLRLVFIFWRSHVVNWSANRVSEDRISKRLRNLLYRSMGVTIGDGSSFAGGGYVHGSALTVGERCFINREYYFDHTAPIVFGNDISVGTQCVFVTAGHEIGPPERRTGPVRPAPIRVENGAWIGTRVTILPGVTIGCGAIVASGSVVVESVPDNVLVAGVPAMVKRRLDSAGPSLSR